ncbi:MAG: hypothetical protein M1829_005537 [Trizodia sp. TS-e1964]|nr:MAG: hypothetical protein M1829_005537 [Trizodia sp. TS-e1964]
MRPPTMLAILLSFFLLSILLTFKSLLYTHPGSSTSFAASNRSQLRALFSFQAPNSFFSPSAVISLTDDNETFFLAQPAAFGPLLPAHGLSGQLWVGSGFGDDTPRKGSLATTAEGELGCSDVPGWGEDKGSSDIDEDPQAESQARNRGINANIAFNPAKEGTGTIPPSGDTTARTWLHNPSTEDGTNNHLHRTLPPSTAPKFPGPGQKGELELENGNRGRPIHADIQSLQEFAEISGKVVLLSRGGCGFLEKVKWAQRRGGIALIVGDHTRGGSLVTMYARGDTSNISIPALFTSHTTAHLLSSLIPIQGLAYDTYINTAKGREKKDSKIAPSDLKFRVRRKSQPDGAASAPTTHLPRSTSLSRSSTESFIARTFNPSAYGIKENRNSYGWLQHLLSTIRLRSAAESIQGMEMDSRRPPSSGQLGTAPVPEFRAKYIAWPSIRSSLKSRSKARNANESPPSDSATTRDGFLIGVQDWRDPDLLDSSAGGSTIFSHLRGSAMIDASPTVDTKEHSKLEIKASGATGLPGGSITPGSGEYHKSAKFPKLAAGDSSQPSTPHSYSPVSMKSGEKGWLRKIKWASDDTTPSQISRPKVFNDQPGTNDDSEDGEDDDYIESNHEGLWVTLTPTRMSTSPFFDTLLVLVISPLVTLTVVYALLLIRSRIRSRRHRAPKSVVERLPIRTYHAITSSQSSLRRAAPPSSAPSSPLLESVSGVSSSRSRSLNSPPVEEPAQDESSNTPENSDAARRKQVEKLAASAGGECRRRYTGRQVECVVCLDEYVDGVSQVMSLPCGHEFHAECITPWLVTRRRTCPICKGDVVRSLALESGEIDINEPLTSRLLDGGDDSSSSRLPIDVRAHIDDDDLERGEGYSETGGRRSLSDRWGAFLDWTLPAFVAEAGDRSR